MSKSLHKCQQCDNTTHGTLCRPCELKRRTIHEDRSEYRRFWQTKKKYNIDALDFETMWIAFRGRCGICEKLLKTPTAGRGQALDVVAIDHNHQTGNTRGLLCNACNKGIGLFNDDPGLLEKARRYLQICEN